MTDRSSWISNRRSFRFVTRCLAYNCYSWNNRWQYLWWECRSALIRSDLDLPISLSRVLWRPRQSRSGSRQAASWLAKFDLCGDLPTLYYSAVQVAWCFLIIPSFWWRQCFGWLKEFREGSFDLLSRCPPFRGESAVNYCSFSRI